MRIERRKDMYDKAYLVLENGRIFQGYFFGKKGRVTGEIVFSTGMTGYIETLTDKSYYGQIIVQTFPLIGNYGIIPEDFESERIYAFGYIVREWCREPSNFRSQYTVDDFLKKHNIVGMYGIDTRELTKILREQGTMNGTITDNPEMADMEKILSYSVKKAVESVSTPEIFTVNPFGKHKVILMDFGYKENIIRELVQRNCQVTVVPYNTSPAKIKSLEPDGILLSNGPGDPADNELVINNLRELVDMGIPIFGICLGHQLLALAFGFKTSKLKFGHRGANQPARDLLTGKTYITSQNHGYAVNIESIDKRIGELWFVNNNDNTCEGIRYTHKPVFSVQFHPEGCGGPKDTGFLFDIFMGEVESYASGQKH